LIDHALSWALFLISRASALRGNSGRREPVEPLMPSVLGRKVSAATPEPKV
jgi:hypothetical protein